MSCGGGDDLARGQEGPALPTNVKRNGKAREA